MKCQRCRQIWFANVPSSFHKFGKSFRCDSRSNPSLTALTLQERLAFRIGSVQVDSSQKNEVGDQTKKEFDYFERHQIRGPLLNKIFNALRSVQECPVKS